MKALEFDVDLSCISVNNTILEPLLTQSSFDSDALAYLEITLTKDPRYKPMYLGVSPRIHALHSRNSVRTYLKPDPPAQNYLLVPQCWCVTGSSTLSATRFLRTVYVIVHARS